MNIIRNYYRLSRYPPFDGLSVRGRAIFTIIVLPSYSVPLSSSIAFWPSVSFCISTKPNPLDFPVYLSDMILAEETSPYPVNNSFKSASFVP